MDKPYKREVSLKETKCPNCGAPIARGSIVFMRRDSENIWVWRCPLCIALEVSVWPVNL